MSRGWPTAPPFLGERDAGGRRICAQCGIPLRGKQRKWCSDHCFRLAGCLLGYQGAMRHVLALRDGGVCEICHLDCARLERWLHRLESGERSRAWADLVRGELVERGHLQARVEPVRGAVDAPSGEGPSDLPLQRVTFEVDQGPKVEVTIEASSWRERRHAERARGDG